MVGREGVEPSTKRLRVQRPFSKPLVSQCFTWNVSPKKPKTMRTEGAPETLGRHGSRERVIVRDRRGRKALRYIKAGCA